MIHSGFNRFNKDADEEKMIIKETDSEGNVTGNIIVPLKPPKKISGTTDDSSESNGADWTEDFNEFNNGGDIGTPTEGEPETPTTTEGTGTSTPSNNELIDNELAALWDQIVNGKKFSYDMNGDALYQQYADIYQNNANLAMQNAMAQSAALTGGYGNSYAQAAGQQAYAQQMQNLNAVGMDLYDRAYSQYQDDRQELYNQFGTLYGMQQDQQALDQWYALYGQPIYDEETGNIIGTTGGYYATEEEKNREWQATEKQKDRDWQDDVRDETNERADNEFDFFYGTERDEKGNIIKTGEGEYDRQAAAERKTKAETASDSSGETAATRNAVQRIDGQLSVKKLSLDTPEGKALIEEEIASLFKGERISEAEMNYLIYYYGLDE